MLKASWGHMVFSMLLATHETDQCRFDLRGSPPPTEKAFGDKGANSIQRANFLLY